MMTIQHGHLGLEHNLSSYQLNWPDFYFQRSYLHHRLLKGYTRQAIPANLRVKTLIAPIPYQTIGRHALHDAITLLVK